MLRKPCGPWVPKKKIEFFLDSGKATAVKAGGRALSGGAEATTEIDIFKMVCSR